MSPFAAEPVLVTGKVDSAVSWPAIIAGAFVTAALALILLALGAGAGLSSLSPWSNSGLTPSAVGTGALIWLAIVEVISCGLGGYIAGRLRTLWLGVHPHEVHFRDTAHGLLVWAVALVITAGFLTSAATAMVGGARNLDAGRAENGATDPGRYFVDRLFRPVPRAPDTAVATGTMSVTLPADASMRTEADLILARAVRDRGLAPDDRAYLAQRVTGATGLSTTQAGERVDLVFAQDQQAVDAARKTAAHALYWLFVALLVGAFSASWMATIGGRHREHLHV